MKKVGKKYKPASRNGTSTVNSSAFGEAADRTVATCEPNAPGQIGGTQP